MSRLAEIKERLDSYKQYYPSDSDLWPSALKHCINDNQWLIDRLETVEAELLSAKINSINTQLKLLHNLRTTYIDE